MIILSQRSKTVYEYDRNRAVDYAHRWAYGRNPRYYDFSEIGGDCTNFASQAVYAGSHIMNYNYVTGWYYIDINNRSPSWTDVNLFHRFLTANNSRGPFGEDVAVKDVQPGDLVQLSFGDKDRFNHTPVIVSTGTPPDISNIYVAAHTDDRDNYPLSSYEWAYIRFIHIKGVYGWT